MGITVTKDEVRVIGVSWDFNLYSRRVRKLRRARRSGGLTASNDDIKLLAYRPWGKLPKRIRLAVTLGCKVERGIYIPPPRYPDGEVYHPR